MEKAGSGRMGKCLERRWWAGSFSKKSSSGEQTRFRPAGRMRSILSLRRGIWGQMSLYRDAPFGGRGFKQGREALLIAGQAVGAREAIAGPGMRRPDTTVGPLDNRLKNRWKRMWAAQGRRPGSAVCGRVWPVRCFLCSGRKPPRFSALPGTSAPGGMAYTIFHRDCRYAISV